MSDPSAQDPVLRALAYAHPLWMVAGIGLVIATLRSGLAMRRARRRGRFSVERRQRHLRRAKIARIWVTPGFIAGPVSMAFLRGREPFATAHAYAALLTIALLLTAGILGRRLERGAPASREVHALVATLAVLASGLAAATGWVLLP